MWTDIIEAHCSADISLCMGTFCLSIYLFYLLRRTFSPSVFIFQSSSNLSGMGHEQWSNHLLVLDLLDGFAFRPEAIFMADWALNMNWLFNYKHLQSTKECCVHCKNNNKQKRIAPPPPFPPAMVAHWTTSLPPPLLPLPPPGINNSSFLMPEARTICSQ